MKECFIVVNSSHCEGMNAYAFYDENNARKSVEEDVAIVEKDLIEQGYKPMTLKNRWYDVTVYVPDSDIYYEWHVIISDIR